MNDTMQRHQPHHGQDVLHDSTFFFTCPFDDSSLCRGSQCLKPIATSFSQARSAGSTKPSMQSSHISTTSEVDTEDLAVLDDDEYDEDELPPSPVRRHSGAISISSEDLPLCYDREALKRDTAAHRAKHQQQLHKLEARGRSASFSPSEEWDTEERKGRRTGPLPPVSSGASRPSTQVQYQQPVSEIDGPMMALWGV